MDEEQRQISIAIKQFTSRATIPLIYDDPKAVDQVGTSWLFTAQNRYFLITAEHTFDQCDPGRFAIPKGRKNDTLHSLGPAIFVNSKVDPSEAEFDIAILELLDPSTLDYVKREWRSMQLENTGRASSSGHFVLCGYPSALAWRNSEVIGGSLITVFTERIQTTPPEAKQPIHPAVDLFFHYDREASDLDSKTISTPTLKGVSGAPVWEYCHPDDGDIWSPERALTIVGIQSSYKAGSYFRAKSWDAIQSMLSKYDTSLFPSA